jgi:RNA polymerase sigma-70 factor (ECF subfamily)
MDRCSAMKQEGSPTERNLMMRLEQSHEPSVAVALEPFEELYRRHHSMVYSLCMRMTRNVSETEDLTQEIFGQIFVKLWTFRGESSFSTWLYRFTVNQVLMHFRKSSVKAEKMVVRGIELDQIAAGAEHPMRMRVIQRIALEEAVRQLPPGYRTVFVLHDVEGCEHHEIAERLGCTVGTSKSQLHKARLRLRVLLGHDGAEASGD